MPPWPPRTGAGLPVRIPDAPRPVIAAKSSSTTQKTPAISSKAGPNAEQDPPTSNNDRQQPRDNRKDMGRSGGENRKDRGGYGRNDKNGGETKDYASMGRAGAAITRAATIATKAAALGPTVSPNSPRGRLPLLLRLRRVTPPRIRHRLLRFPRTQAPQPLHSGSRQQPVQRHFWLQPRIVPLVQESQSASRHPLLVH